MQGDLFMAWPRPPVVSGKGIDKAGKNLVCLEKYSDEWKDAYDLMDHFRASHSYPINTFQVTLRRKVKGGSFGSDAFIAQRLKRSQTILQKLGQLERIRLSNMQDIAGVRAVLPSIEDVYKLVREYTEVTRFEHELVRFKDYIQEPKKDGYRSYHLIYKYNNKNHSDWNGLFIELQIRTGLQHCWATAVEAVLTYLGRAIKAREGQKSDKEWTNFFAMVSTAFAYIEGSPVGASHRDMSKKDILQKIVDCEKKLKVKDKLDALPVAFKAAYEREKKSHYCLIILNSITRKVSIVPFRRDQVNEANAAYVRAEKEYETDPGIDPVLVSTTDGYLQKAYAGFFGDTSDFRKNLEYVLSGGWVK